MKMHFSHSGRQFFFLTFALKGRLKALSRIVAVDKPAVRLERVLPVGSARKRRQPRKLPAYERSGGSPLLGSHVRAAKERSGGIMATLSMFYGIIVKMNKEDREPHHKPRIIPDILAHI